MPRHQRTVVDLTANWPQEQAEYLPAHRPATWAVTGRVRYGWALSLAVGADDDLFFEVVPGSGQYASYRHAILTITSPSHQAAQLATITASRGRRPSVTALLDGMGLEGPLAAALDPATAAHRTKAGWDAARVLFAALNTPKVLSARPNTGRIEYDEPLAWAAAGFTRREAAQWQAWFDWARVAADYRHAGFTPQEGSLWAGVHECVPADLARSFQAAGWDSIDLSALTFHLGGPTPGTLAAWLSVRAPSHLVLAAARAGLGPEEAAAIAQNQGLDGEVLAGMQALRGGPALSNVPVAAAT